MKKVIVFFSALLLLLCSFPNPIFASVGVSTWVSKAPLPEKIHQNALATVNGKIYSIGGHTYSSGGKTNSVYEYNPGSDTWTKKANMPTARHSFASAVVNNKIYIIGGIGYLNTVEEYDPATDTWTTKANMPTGRQYLSATVYNNKIYVAGGRDASYALSNKLEVFNPALNSWETKADMKVLREKFSLVTVKDSVYAIGGSTSSSIERYEINSNTWYTVGDLGRTIGLPSCVTVNNLIYIIGGTEIIGGKDAFVRSNVLTYDTSSNVLGELPNLTIGRFGFGATILNNELYVVGGELGLLGSSHTDLVEKLTILDTNEPKPDPEDDGDRAILSITMTTGLTKEYDLSIDEVNAFLTWYDARDAGRGPGMYAIDKHSNNKGPFKKRKDYVVFDKILTYEVSEYTTSE